MHNNKDYYNEQEDEVFHLEKAVAAIDGKKIKPHVIRRHVEDYLERKALERRLKDIFEDDL
ncbi:MAG: hypothetical protein RL122_1987 [Pseudomonadota bacterium]|jgi:hypothetical protein|uniref:Uncharacterized protein n=1 Tax=Thiothrix fructosivorans TaxID=111770 RepID=A0A8B0SL53_9GAMM|nr:hypothetical protein [Thiothrix fructosivorans]MBO0611542.1 hypothetical protein [Thiothrix fructosivorans]QTX10788.1 hypothetical protein J1836_019895 [Thiothrix fructosivorans]